MQVFVGSLFTYVQHFVTTQGWIHEGDQGDWSPPKIKHLNF